MFCYFKYVNLLLKKNIYSIINNEKGSEDMLKFINKHKGLSIVIGLSLILFIIMLIIFISLVFSRGKGAYGNRLDGIENVKLEKSFLDSIKEELTNDTGIAKAKVRLQGKIVYIDMEAEEDTSVDTAKELSSKILEKFSKDELEFYDICYMIKWTKENENKEKEITVIEGTKHPLKENISWIK